MGERKTVLSILSCLDREAIAGDLSGWSVASSITDQSGYYGSPRIETLWIPGSLKDRDLFVGLRDVRHPDPDGGKDTAPCEHYIMLCDWRVDQ